VATGELKVETTLQDAQPQDIAFSPSGRVLAIGCRESGEYGAGGVWTWKFGLEAPERLNGHSSVVNTVVFQNAEPVLATGSDDWTARLWTIEE
jgi:hypothetical protein